MYMSYEFFLVRRLAIIVRAPTVEVLYLFLLQGFSVRVR